MAETAEAEGKKRRDASNGRYVTTVSDEAILEFVAEHELVGTADVADRIGRVRETAYRRLKALEEDGKVRGRHIGNSLTWTLADEESEV